MQDFLAFPVIELNRLLLVELVEIGVAAIRKNSAFDGMRFETGRGIAKRAGAGLDDIFERFFGEALDEGGPLDRSKLRPDTDSLQVVDDSLANIRVRRVAVVIAGVKPLGVARLGEQVLRFVRVVDRGRGLPEELVMVGNDRVAGNQRVARVSASFVPSRSIARLAARRTRSSCQGDFGSHWSGK
jgi:hypothetical protein